MSIHVKNTIQEEMFVGEGPLEAGEEREITLVSPVNFRIKGVELTDAESVSIRLMFIGLLYLKPRPQDLLDPKFWNYGVVLRQHMTVGFTIFGHRATSYRIVLRGERIADDGD